MKSIGIRFTWASRVNDKDQLVEGWNEAEVGNRVPESSIYYSESVHLTGSMKMV